MPDIVAADVRGRMMGAIRQVDTAPEMKVRRFLHSRGFRYRLHDSRLPGRPDIVLPRWGAVVQVHGCFWHAHRGCPHFKLPHTRRGFWREKLTGNRLRDERNRRQLLAAGWRLATIWECALRERNGDETLRHLDRWLRRQQTMTLDLEGYCESRVSIEL